MTVYVLNTLCAYSATAIASLDARLSDLNKQAVAALEDKTALSSNISLISQDDIIIIFPPVYKLDKDSNNKIGIPEEKQIDALCAQLKMILNRNNLPSKIICVVNPDKVDETKRALPSNLGGALSLKHKAILKLFPDDHFNSGRGFADRLLAKSPNLFNYQPPKLKPTPKYPKPKALKKGDIWQKSRLLGDPAEQKKPTTFQLPSSAEWAL